MPASMRNLVRALGFIASVPLLLSAMIAVPCRGQRAEAAAPKARARENARSVALRNDEDPRMASFRLRAKARWRAQQIVARKAEAAYHKARLDREIAEIRLLEYEETMRPQDLAVANGELALAESDLSRATDRLEWAQRMQNKGFVGQAQVVSEGLALKKAIFTLAQARAKKLAFLSFSKGATFKELKSEVEKTRSSERATKATWDLEKSRESELERRADQVKGVPGKAESH